MDVTDVGVDCTYLVCGIGFGTMDDKWALNGFGWEVGPPQGFCIADTCWPSTRDLPSPVAVFPRCHRSRRLSTSFVNFNWFNPKLYVLSRALVAFSFSLCYGSKCVYPSPVDRRHLHRHARTVGAVYSVVVALLLLVAGWFHYPYRQCILRSVHP